MTQKFTNNARALVQNAINPLDTTLTIEVAKADRYPVANTTTWVTPLDWFKCTLVDSAGNIEIVKVGTRTLGSGVFGNVLRGQDGTTARSFAIGSVAVHAITSTDIENALIEDVWKRNVPGVGGQGFSHTLRLIENDAVQGTAGGAGKVDGVQIVHTFGGATAKGGRHGFEVFCILTAPTAVDNPDRNYVGAAMIGEARTGDGGTAIAPRGAVFGINPVASLQAGATFLANLSGAEINTATKPGSSVTYKSGIQITGFSDDAVQGSLVDAMISLSGQGGVGWRDGILFSNNNGGNPMDAVNGVLMRTQGAATLKDAFDLFSYTFTDSIIKAKNFNLNKDGCLELGKLGAANTPYINFHSSATINAYDARLISLGGGVGLGTAILRADCVYLDLVGTGYRINATQVVGPRRTGWGVASNGSRNAFDGATATPLQTAQAVAFLIADLTTHGLIGA